MKYRPFKEKIRWEHRLYSKFTENDYYDGEINWGESPHKLVERQIKSESNCVPVLDNH